MIAFFSGQSDEILREKFGESAKRKFNRTIVSINQSPSVIFSDGDASRKFSGRKMPRRFGRAAVLDQNPVALTEKT